MSKKRLLAPLASKNVRLFLAGLLLMALAALSGFIRHKFDGYVGIPIGVGAVLLIWADGRAHPGPRAGK